MAFGNPSLPTRKYAYHIRFTHDNYSGKSTMPPEVREQLYLANEFRNDLVTLEIARRAAYHGYLAENSDEVKVCNEKVAKLEELIGEKRKALAKSNIKKRAEVSDPVLVAEIKDLVGQLKDAWAERTAVEKKVRVTPAIQAELRSQEIDFRVKRDAAMIEHKKRGLTWGTASFMTSTVKRAGYPPRRRGFDGTGVLAVQLTKKAEKGATRSLAYHADGRPVMKGKKHIKRPSAHALFNPAKFFSEEATFCRARRNPDRGKKSVTVDFRIGSNPDRSPKWFTFQIAYHRDLPPDGELKWAYVVVSKVATHTEYEFMVDVSKTHWAPPPGRVFASEGTVAVALGWRQIGNVLRVASWKGSDGQTGDVEIHENDLSRWITSWGIRSTREKLFEEARVKLVNWLKGKKLPEKFAEEVKAVHQWRSPDRLARLIYKWRTGALKGPAGAHKILEELEGVIIEGGNPKNGRNVYVGWRRQNRHLHDWEGYGTRNAVAWRKYLYRHIALDLAKKYKRVVIENINWADLGENKEIERANENVNKRYRNIAACASLKDRLVEYFKDAHAGKAAYVVRDCAVCKTRCKDPGRKRFIDCPKCGKQYDRLQNAAANLLARDLAARARKTPGG